MDIECCGMWHCVLAEEPAALTLKAAGSTATSARVHQVAQRHSWNRRVFIVVMILCEI